MVRSNYGPVSSGIRPSHAKMLHGQEETKRMGRMRNGRPARILKGRSAAVAKFPDGPSSTTTARRLRVQTSGPTFVVGAFDFPASSRLRLLPYYTMARLQVQLHRLGT
jgi:hypothetical protein